MLQMISCKTYVQQYPFLTNEVKTDILKDNSYKKETLPKNGGVTKIYYQSDKRRHIKMHFITKKERIHNKKER